MAHPLGDQPDRPGPLVIAHRGASIDRAEHTLAAYRLAIESGADGLECDVRLTRDGHLVCIHDRTVDRTSDGTGPVSARTLAQLGRLNAAAWHEGPGATGAILTLVDLLELVRATERPLRLLIETKHPTRYGPRVEQQLALALDRFGFTAPTPSASQAIVMSFAASALRRMQRLRPDGSTVLLMESMLGSRRTGGLPTGTSIAGPSVELTVWTSLP